MIIMLDISTWAGLSINAEHYYGSLYHDGTHVRVEHAVTRQEAEKLNRKDGKGTRYEAGEITERFDSAEDVRKRAVSCWLESYSEGKILLEGSPALAQPCPVLVCVDEVIGKQLNKIAHRAAVSGGWLEDHETMERLCSEWDTILEILTGEEV